MTKQFSTLRKYYNDFQKATVRSGTHNFYTEDDAKLIKKLSFFGCDVPESEIFDGEYDEKKLPQYILPFELKIDNEYVNKDAAMVLGLKNDLLLVKDHINPLTDNPELNELIKQFKDKLLIVDEDEHEEINDKLEKMLKDIKYD